MMLTFNSPVGTKLTGIKHLEGVTATVTKIKSFNNLVTGDKYEVDLVMDHGQRVTWGLSMVNSYFVVAGTA